MTPPLPLFEAKGDGGGAPIGAGGYDPPPPTFRGKGGRGGGQS